jgi:hypothetical protein
VAHKAYRKSDGSELQKLDSLGTHQNEEWFFWDVYDYKTIRVTTLKDGDSRRQWRTDSLKLFFAVDYRPNTFGVEIREE